MGRVAKNFLAMSKRVKPETDRTRGDVGKLLVEGAREGIQTQLYEVSKGPLTGKMKRSIRPRFLGARQIAVGWDLAVAPYAWFREQKRGRSKLYGHQMDLDIPGHIERTKGEQIRARGFEGLRRIVEGK